MLHMALTFLDKMEQQNQEDGLLIRLRIGIHIGPCFITALKFHVHHTGIFGLVLPQTAIIHATGIAGKCHISQPVREQIESDDFQFNERGIVMIESEPGNMGKMVETYWASWSNDDGSRRSGEDTESELGILKAREIFGPDN